MQITVFCPQCGTESSAKAKFCRDCGEKLTLGGGDEQIPESTALTKEVQAISDEMSNNNLKPLFWLLAAAVFWFMAINPAQGNFLGITYLDLALADCGDSSSGDSSGIDFIDDLASDFDEACRDSRSEAQAVVVFGIIVIGVLIRAATKKPNSDRKSQESPIQTSSQGSEKGEYAKEIQNLSEAIKIAKKAEKAAKALEKAIEAQESSEAEWEKLKRLDDIKRARVRKTALASIFAGIVVAGAISVLGASEVVLTPEQSEASSSYALYISWAIALISFAKLSTNPVIPDDHPLKTLRDSLYEKRRKAEKLDADLAELVALYDVSASTDLEALEAMRLAFVEKHSPMMDGVAP